MLSYSIQRLLQSLLHFAIMWLSSASNNKSWKCPVLYLQQTVTTLEHGTGGNYVFLGHRHLYFRQYYFLSLRVVPCCWGSRVTYWQLFCKVLLIIDLWKLGTSKTTTSRDKEKRLWLTERRLTYLRFLTEHPYSCFGSQALCKAVTGRMIVEHRDVVPLFWLCK